MALIAHKLLAETPVGVVATLPRAGTAMENPFVYDSVARDIKAQALRGSVEIVAETKSGAAVDELIRHLEFRRTR